MTSLLLFLQKSKFFKKAANEDHSSISSLHLFPTLHPTLGKHETIKQHDLGSFAVFLWWNKNADSEKSIKLAFKDSDVEMVQNVYNIALWEGWFISKWDYRIYRVEGREGLLTSFDFHRTNVDLKGL